MQKYYVTVLHTSIHILRRYEKRNIMLQYIYNLVPGLVMQYKKGRDASKYSYVVEDNKLVQEGV